MESITVGGLRVNYQRSGEGAGAAFVVTVSNGHTTEIAVSEVPAFISALVMASNGAAAENLALRSAEISRTVQWRKDKARTRYSYAMLPGGTMAEVSQPPDVGQWTPTWTARVDGKIVGQALSSMAAAKQSAEQYVLLNSGGT